MNFLSVDKGYPWCFAHPLFSCISSFYPIRLMLVSIGENHQAFAVHLKRLPFSLVNRAIGPVVLSKPFNLVINKLSFVEFQLGPMEFTLFVFLSVFVISPVESSIVPNLLAKSMLDVVEKFPTQKTFL